MRFLGLLLINIFLTGILFGIFWWLYSGDIKAQSILSVVGSLFTVIGYILTIYQVAQLRNEQETIKRTREQVKIDYFKIETFAELRSLHADLDSLVQGIDSTTNFTEESLNNYINQLNRAKNVLVQIDVKQRGLGDTGIRVLSCDDCKTLLDSSIKSFEEVIETETIPLFKKISHTSCIRKIVSVVVELETKIKD